MKVMVLISIVFILSVFEGQAQNIEKGRHWDVLKKISNSNADFFVSNPVRLKDTAGNLIGIRNIVVLENGHMNKVAQKYGNELLPELISMLGDSTRDWAANLLLYSITNTDAVVLKYYSVGRINEWRSRRKQDDIERWKEYLKKPD